MSIRLLEKKVQFIKGMDVDKINIDKYLKQKVNEDFFNDLFKTTEQEIEQVQLSVRINQHLLDNELISYIWKVEFKGAGLYDGKLVEGLLIFRENYPQQGPVFFFGQPKALVGQPLRHENIYATNELCNPLCEIGWKPVFGVVGILNSIICVFGTPDINSPANMQFKQETEEFRLKVHAEQRQMLEEWVN